MLFRSLDVEDVRTLHQQLHRVDLSDVRPLLIDLVARLRHAGLPVSDRRAVKLQRLVAASALLSARDRARRSDVWVFRYIWDTVEQQEVLAAVVHETLAKLEAAPDDHPRARGNDAPDPEALARDLNELSTRADSAGDPGDRAALADRLGMLAGRCQWVADARQRQILLDQVAQLWKKVGTQPA